MQIVSVTYQKLVTGGNRYSNERVGATAEVGDGETADQVLAALRAWVYGHVGLQTEVDDIVRTLGTLRQERDQLVADINMYQTRWERARAFLEHHGIDLDRERLDLPF